MSGAADPGLQEQEYEAAVKQIDPEDQGTGVRAEQESEDDKEVEKDIDVLAATTEKSTAAVKGAEPVFRGDVNTVDKPAENDEVRPVSGGPDDNDEGDPVSSVRDDSIAFDPDGGELKDGGGGNEVGEEQSDVGQTMEDDPTEGWDAEHKGEARESAQADAANPGQPDSVVTDTASNPGDSGALSDDDELAATDAAGSAGSYLDMLDAALRGDMGPPPMTATEEYDASILAIDQVTDIGLIQGCAVEPHGAHPGADIIRDQDAEALAADETVHEEAAFASQPVIGDW